MFALIIIRKEYVKIAKFWFAVHRVETKLSASLKFRELTHTSLNDRSEISIFFEKKNFITEIR